MSEIFPNLPPPWEPHLFIEIKPQLCQAETLSQKEKIFFCPLKDEMESPKGPKTQQQMKQRWKIMSICTFQK